MTRLRSLRMCVTLGAVVLTGCGLGAAHRVPGTDLALPASSYANDLLLALPRPCSVIRSPTPSTTPTPEQAKQACPTSADTAVGQPGLVGRGPVRVP
jgi:hypothetical protein